MATTNTIVVKFVDGEVLYLDGVTNYLYNYEMGYFVIEKNGYKQFVPAKNVKYIGRKFDLEGDK